MSSHGLHSPCDVVILVLLLIMFILFDCLNLRLPLSNKNLVALQKLLRLRVVNVNRVYTWPDEAMEDEDVILDWLSVLKVGRVQDLSRFMVSGQQVLPPVAHEGLNLCENALVGLAEIVLDDFHDAMLNVPDQIGLGVSSLLPRVIDLSPCEQGRMLGLNHFNALDSFIEEAGAHQDRQVAELVFLSERWQHIFDFGQRNLVLDGSEKHMLVVAPIKELDILEFAANVA